MRIFSTLIRRSFMYLVLALALARSLPFSYKTLPTDLLYAVGLLDLVVEWLK